MSNHDEARAWAYAGYPVFPIKENQKYPPLTEHGFKDATTDPEQIAAWWERWPNANIGIATDGLLVVDVDVKNGARGMDSLVALQDIYGMLPQTLTQQTPTGGLHLIYTCDDSVRGRIGLPVDVIDGPSGIDIKSNGGYLVAAPSSIDGQCYQRNDIPPVAAPPWLIDLVGRRNESPTLPTPTPAHQRVNGALGPRQRAYVTKALDEECSAVAGTLEGGRNIALNNAAFNIGQLVGAGWVDSDTAFDALHAAGMRAGLDDRETRRTIKSGLDDGMLQPRAPLDDPTPVESPHPGPSADLSFQATEGAPMQDAIIMPYAYPPVSAKIHPPTPPWKVIEEKLHKDEIGDAELFAYLYDQRIAHDLNTDLWYQWGGHSWVKTSDHSLLLLLAGHLAHVYSTYSAHLTTLIYETNDEGEKTKLGTMQKTAQARVRALAKRARITNVLALTRGMFGINSGVWDSNPYLMGVRNGVIDLRTGALVAGEPSHYIRKVAPVVWAGLDAPAPRWEQFINEVFTDEYEPVRAYSQRLLGYSLIGQVREQILPIFWGTGGNGKGTMIETLRAVLGVYASALQSEALMERAQAANAGAPSPHLMDLQGARFVWASETNKGKGFDNQAVKWLTGGDTIVARPPFGREMVQFKPTHQMILITNHKPRADSEDDAFWRRARLIPFINTFSKLGDDSKNERGLQDIMPATESSGIFAWLVRGALAYLAEGLNDPACVLAATNEYRQDEDTVGQFIAECCFEGKGATVTPTKLYESYEQWCKDNGCKPYSHRNLSKILEKRYKRHRTGQKGRFWLGIGLLDTEHPDSQPSHTSDGWCRDDLGQCRESDTSKSLFIGSESEIKENSDSSDTVLGNIPHESTLFSESGMSLKNTSLPSLNRNNSALGANKTLVTDNKNTVTPSHLASPSVTGTTPIPPRGGARRGPGADGGRHDDDKERQAREALNSAHFVSAFASASLISNADRKAALMSEIETAEAAYLASREAA